MEAKGCRQVVIEDALGPYAHLFEDAFQMSASVCTSLGTFVSSGGIHLGTTLAIACGHAAISSP